MPMQILRTPTPNLPPTGLAEGQLSVEMASVPPKLWVGVPVTIDASGRIQLNASAGGIPEPTTAGNYLRTNTGTWVAGLPLTGGLLGGVNNDIQLDVNLRVASGTGIRVNNWGSTSATGINVEQWGSAPGLNIGYAGTGRAVSIIANNPGYSSTTTGLYLRGDSVAAQVLIEGWRVNPTTTRMFAIRANGSVQIVHESIIIGAVSELPNVALDVRGNVAVGDPTGPTVTGAGSVNISGGYYVNGKAMVFGAPDSAGAGYRTVSIEN